MVAHWGESKTVSYAKEQSTSFIAAMWGALLLYCSFFQHESRVNLTDCSNLESIYLEPCGFVHYSMDTTQVRQAPGRPGADLGCAYIVYLLKMSLRNLLIHFLSPLSRSLQLG